MLNAVLTGLIRNCNSPYAERQHASILVVVLHYKRAAAAFSSAAVAAASRQK